MAFTQTDPFDFTVGDIEFVIFRKPDIHWKMDPLSKRKRYVLAFALSGKAKYATESGSFLVEKGDVLFFRKGETHSAMASPEDPWSFISVAFSLLPVEKDNEVDLDLLPTVTKVPLFSEYADLFSEIHELWTLHEGGSLLKCRSLIGNLLYLLIREAQRARPALPHGDTVARIKNFLAENYTRTFRVEELAAMAQLSNSHFRMLFKQYTGETVLGFQNRLKIAKACDLLRSGTCNVTETAYAVGFGDIYYFSRLFKKMTGHNPSYYLQK